MGISSPFLPTLMLTDLLTDFCVSTSMTSPPVTGLVAGVDDGTGCSVVLLLAVLELGLELVAVVAIVVVLLLLLAMVLVAGSVGSSVVGENATLDS